MGLPILVTPNSKPNCPFYILLTFVYLLILNIANLIYCI
nr:MAG TPA: hypothetical protein [Crassvirales sp.]